MIVKMRKTASEEEVRSVEDRLHELGYATGKMVGEEITLIGVYGDVSKVPRDEILDMAGVEELIDISKAYKRASQKGDPTNRLYVHFPIGNVMIGKDLVVVAGPCSVESERQIMEAAEMVKEAGAHILRGGVHKYRSSPYSGWEGIGAESDEALRRGLQYIVKAGREFDLPVVVELLDHTKVEIYEDLGVDCIQIGEPNSRNTAMLNRLRSTKLPVIHKRGNSLDCEAYLLWVERMMIGDGKTDQYKENIILCERGVMGPNNYTRNTLDLGSVAAFHYQLTGLPVAVDASHGTGIRDLVHPMSLAGIMAGASVLMVEAHPNPLVAKSDGYQTLFPEQLRQLIEAAREVWDLRKRIEKLYLPSTELEMEYNVRAEEDKRRFAESTS